MGAGSLRSNLVPRDVRLICVMALQRPFPQRGDRGDHLNSSAAGEKRRRIWTSAVRWSCNRVSHHFILRRALYHAAGFSCPSHGTLHILDAQSWCWASHPGSQLGSHPGSHATESRTPSHRVKRPHPHPDWRKVYFNWCAGQIQEANIISSLYLHFWLLLQIF